MYYPPSRRIESLEASLASERETPATLQVSRASSHSSLLDGVTTTTATSTGTPPPVSVPPGNKPHTPHDMQLNVPSASEGITSGTAATIPLSDEEVRACVYCLALKVAFA